MQEGNDNRQIQGSLTKKIKIIKVSLTILAGTQKFLTPGDANQIAVIRQYNSKLNL